MHIFDALLHHQAQGNGPRPGAVPTHRRGASGRAHTGTEPGRRGLPGVAPRFRAEVDRARKRQEGRNIGSWRDLRPAKGVPKEMSWQIARALLIVDDHVDLAENLAEILIDAGYQADIAETAEEALERFAAADYQGVITDFRLPGRSGVELVVELRRAGYALPVVMVSAFADSDVVAEAEQVGALDVLPKPVDFDRLFSLVQEFERGKRSVLVVDDNEELAADFAEALRLRGLEPVTVTLQRRSGAFATRAAAGCRPRCTPPRSERNRSGQTPARPRSEAAGRLRHRICRGGPGRARPACCRACPVAIESRRSLQNPWTSSYCWSG